MLVATLAAISIAAAPARPVCSLIAYDFQRQADRSYFTAVPLPDTAAAGMGTMRLGMFPEEPRPGAPPRRMVFGQVVRLDRLGGADTAVVEAAFRANAAREAVLVPWEFDAGCRPAVWRAGARWAELGTEGFYVAQLRDRAHWAGARPTFDVLFAGRYPYPTGSFFRSSPSPAARLSAGEYFELYNALPSSRTPYAQRQEAARRLWSWARANAAVAARHPAAAILAEVRNYYGWSEADVDRLMSAPPPAGTGGGR